MSRRVNNPHDPKSGARIGNVLGAATHRNRVARARTARTARYRRIKDEVRKFWSRVHQERRDSDARWNEANATVDGGLLNMDLSAEEAADPTVGVQHQSQVGWIRQQRKKLDSMLLKVDRECSKVTAEDILKVLPEEEVMALRLCFDESEEGGEPGRLGIVLSAAYMHERQQIAVATETGLLEYYHIRTDRSTWVPDTSFFEDLHWKLRREFEAKVRQEKLRAAQARMRLLWQAFCDETSLVLHWDALMGPSGLLFSGTRSGSIYMFDADRQSSQEGQLPAVHSFMKHVHKAADGSSESGEPVSACTTIPGIAGHRKLITASFFGQVHMTDIEKQVVVELKGTLPSQKHHQGVYCLDYLDELNLMITAGFESEAIIWMPIQSANQFVAKLVDTEDPHKTSLLGAYLVPGTHQVLTADKSGVLKMWDLRKAFCMRTWYLERGMTDLEAMAYKSTNFMFDPSPESRAVHCLSKTDSGEARFYTMVPEKPLQLKQSSSHDVAVASVLFNQATNTFISAAGRDVRLWDAETGSPALSLPDTAPDTITAMCLDHSGRRFTLGTHGGHVTIHSYATGAVIQRFEPHDSEVTALCHLEAPKFIVSASRSGEVRVFNEMQDERTVQVAPQFTLRGFGAVGAIAYSPVLHLLAFGDACEVLHVWDFHTNLHCNPQAKCARRTLGENYVTDIVTRLHQDPGSPAAAAALSPKSDWGPQDGGSLEDINYLTDRALECYMNPKAHEVTALVFLSPLAAIVSADASGHINLWTVRPYQWAYELFVQWRSKGSFDYASRFILSVVSALGWSYEDDMTLISADDHGSLTLWDMRDIVSYLDLRPTAFPPPWTRRKDPSAMPDPLRKKPTLRIQWVVSPEAPITSVCVIPTASAAAVSCADRTVTLWSLDGRYLGQLNQGRTPNDPVPEDYRFRCKAAEARMQQDDEMLDSIIKRTLERRGTATGSPTSPRGRRRSTRSESSGDEGPLSGRSRRRSSRAPGLSGKRRSVRLLPMPAAKPPAAPAAKLPTMLSKVMRSAGLRGPPEATAVLTPILGAVTGSSGPSAPPLDSMFASWDSGDFSGSFTAPSAQASDWSGAAAPSPPPRPASRMVVSVVDDMTRPLADDTFMLEHDTYTPPDSPVPPRSPRNSPAQPTAGQPRLFTTIDSTERPTVNSILSDPTSPKGSPVPPSSPPHQQLVAGCAAHPIWQQVERRHRKLRAAERGSALLSSATVRAAQSALWQEWNSSMTSYLNLQEGGLSADQVARLRSELIAQTDDAELYTKMGLIYGRRPLKHYGPANISDALLSTTQRDGHYQDARALAQAPPWVRGQVESFQPHVIHAPIAPLLTSRPPPVLLDGASSAGSSPRGSLASLSGSMVRSHRRRPSAASPPSRPAASPRSPSPLGTPRAADSPAARFRRVRSFGAARERQLARERERQLRAKPKSEFARIARAVPLGRAGMLADGESPTRPFRGEETPRAPDAAQAVVEFGSLLAGSAPQYPITESPYLSVGTAPALSPLKFPMVYQARCPAEEVPPEMLRSVAARGRRRIRAKCEAAAPAAAVLAAATTALLEELLSLRLVGPCLIIAGAVCVVRSDPLRQLRYTTPQIVPEVRPEPPPITPLSAAAATGGAAAAPLASPGARRRRGSGPGAGSPPADPLSQPLIPCSPSFLLPTATIPEALPTDEVEVCFDQPRQQRAIVLFSATAFKMVLALESLGQRRRLGRVASFRWDGRLLVDFDVSAPGAAPTPAWPVQAPTATSRQRVLLHRVATAARFCGIPHPQVRELLSEYADDEIWNDELLAADPRKWKALTQVQWAADRRGPTAAEVSSPLEMRNQGSSETPSAFGARGRSVSISADPSTEQIRLPRASFAQSLGLSVEMEDAAEAAAVKVRRRASRGAAALSEDEANTALVLAPARHGHKGALPAEQQPSGPRPAHQRARVTALLPRGERDADPSYLHLANPSNWDGSPCPPESLPRRPASAAPHGVGLTLGRAECAAPDPPPPAGAPASPHPARAEARPPRERSFVNLELRPASAPPEVVTPTRGRAAGIGRALSPMGSPRVQAVRAAERAQREREAAARPVVNQRAFAAACRGRPPPQSPPAPLRPARRPAHFCSPCPAGHRPTGTLPPPRPRTRQRPLPAPRPGSAAPRALRQRACSEPQRAPRLSPVPLAAAAAAEAAPPRERHVLSPVGPRPAQPASRSDSSL